MLKKGNSKGQLSVRVDSFFEIYCLIINGLLNAKSELLKTLQNQQYRCDLPTRNTHDERKL